MALTERSRNKIYETFTNLIDDEQAIEEMLSYFPARDVEEPVTKEHLRAELLATRSDLKGDIAAVDAKIGSLRTDLKGDIADLRTELHVELRKLHTQMWTNSLAVAGLIIAVLKLWN